MIRRPELLPAALVALVLILATVLAALHVDAPAFLPLIGTAAAGAAFGITVPTGASNANPAVDLAGPAPIDGR